MHFCSHLEGSCLNIYQFERWLSKIVERIKHTIYIQYISWDLQIVKQKNFIFAVSFHVTRDM
jgi:hypothetical protein